MIEERWLTVDDVATALRVNPETIRRWIKAGRLPAYDLGRKAGYRLRPSEVEQFVVGKRAESGMDGSVTDSRR